jgi:hypothetical protein
LDSSRLGLETIANSPLVLDQFRRLRSVFDFGAEIADVETKVMAAINVLGTPDVSDEPRMTDGPPGFADEESEELEFNGRKVYLDSFAKGLVLVEDQLQIARHNALSVSWRRRGMTR